MPARSGAAGNMTGGFHHATHGAADAGTTLLLLHGADQTEASLVEVAKAAVPDAFLIAVRGLLAMGDGYAFFRRHPDGTLDYADLAARTKALCGFVADVARDYQLRRPPVMLGYSNGAIIAAAVACARPGLTAGAVLFRPLSPAPETDFPRLDGYPVLILAGAEDPRRHPDDARRLETQLRHADARVTSVVSPTGHDLHPSEPALVRAWLDHAVGS